MTQHIKQTYNEDVISKSAEDKRLYRGLELTNGMKVLLVSDPDTDKASAALDVNIGYMKDPWELQGLAHFCEHMLFLGTKKYPEENEYNKFLSEHGGSSNAFTSSEHTNFYFDVAAENLAGALDRFSQFFHSPLFTPSATEREVNAVNSENDKNLQNDAWRAAQLERSLANPKHDYYKFGTGNKSTLETLPKASGIDVRDELLKFHSKYYSSNIMGLCVLGKETLDELSELVVPLFYDVENKNLTVPEWLEQPFEREEYVTRVNVVPVKDVRHLNVFWSIPDLQPYYTSNPGHYLGHLIGHEGEGSLLSELKSRGWVNMLMGGQKAGAKGFAFFIVTVDLTDDGLDHVDDIVTLIYQYINMLKKEGTKEWIFNECKDLSAMTFRFKDKEKPHNYTSKHAGYLHEFFLPEVLSGPYIMSEYRPDLIEMVLQKLTIDNMKMIVMAKKFESEAHLKEKWYDTDYSISKVSPETLNTWSTCGLHNNLRLPEKNEFIATNFDIIPNETEDTPLTRLWYKKDEKFLLPKSCTNIELTTPLSYSDPVQSNLTYLFVTLFADNLNEYAYAAELAGLHYNLQCTPYGIHLSLKGYNDKQDILLKKILEKLTTFKVDSKRFEIIKELYERSLRNFEANQPHAHVTYYTSVLMSEVYWTNQELLDCLDEVTVEKMEKFMPQLLSKLYIEALIYGNTSKQKAIETIETVESVLQTNIGTKPLLPSLRKRYREIQLPDGCYYIYQKTNKVHKSSCIQMYYQTGIQCKENNMLLELLCQIINEPCFNILRTQEQLGYIVMSGVRRSSGVQGLRFIIQSDKSPIYVESRVEVFIQKMEEYLDNLSEEDFQKHLKALASKRAEQPKKMSLQNNRYWNEISSQQYHFDRDACEIACLKTFSKTDLINYFKEMIVLNAPKRHKLSVHVISSSIENETINKVADDIIDGLAPPPTLPPPVIIEDVNSFKNTLGLYPLAKPYIDINTAKSKL
ncbi:hypothetical protein LOTGIDRAFT_232210 [Lottia gigantea]|uniref:Insulin-degrading enzyme n=1 Tax=Lottia gigantea TaxID=225164 RepID=V4ANC9_LOTGI|nr:hypothetical protein LOTGIDRAFT_232210 [Lottia gigantea]ESO95121.1 hypothetical protein LOTGIDRAFT_232210 [Lottia gigantea]